MKRVAALVFSLAMVVFSVPALNAQTETGSTGTQNTQTDSTNQGTTGTTGTDQTGSSTGNTQGTNQENTGTDNTGTTGTSGTDNTGTTGTVSETGNTGTMGTDNSGNSGTTTQTGNSGMSSTGSGMSSYGMNNSATPAVQDLSRLDEKPTPEVVNEFKPVAEERANELVSKLGLEQDKADKIRESIMDYFNNYWESRVSLDKDSNDPDEVSDHNADLADQRVDLIADIEDELTDDQINQFRSFKVDWWKSLDIALFDVQQNAATSSLARDNKEGSDEQQ